jgi:rare lipoprotein A
MGRRDGLRLIGVVRRAALLAGCLALAQCASSDKFARRVDPKYGVSASPRVVADGEPIPKGGGVYRVGKPYVVAGQLYVPEENRAYHAVGVASWYGEDFHGRATANGEVFDMNAISAAHPTLPMPCYVRVSNLANGRSVIVRVNDRGPFHGNRVIDVSIRAAQLLGFHQVGLARVRVDYVGQAPLEGEDERTLLATLRQGTPAPPPSRVMVAAPRPFVPAADEPRRLPAPPDRAYTRTSTWAPAEAPHGTYTVPPRDDIASLINGRGLY